MNVEDAVTMLDRLVEAVEAGQEADDTVLDLQAIRGTVELSMLASERRTSELGHRVLVLRRALEHIGGRASEAQSAGGPAAPYSGVLSRIEDTACVALKDDDQSADASIAADPEVAYWRQRGDRMKASSEQWAKRAQVAEGALQAVRNVVNGHSP